MPAGNTHSSGRIYQRLAVNEVTPGRWRGGKKKSHGGFQLKDKKCGKLIDALVIGFDNRFNIVTVLLWVHAY